MKRGGETSGRSPSQFGTFVGPDLSEDGRDWESGDVRLAPVVPIGSRLGRFFTFPLTPFVPHRADLRPCVQSASSAGHTRAGKGEPREPVCRPLGRAIACYVVTGSRSTRCVLGLLDCSG